MQRFGRFLALAAVGLTVMLTVVDVAEARRSSSGFGSRGTRTFQTPAITRTAPNTATPIDRTMTQPSANQATGQQGLGQAARPGAQSRGLFGGFAGSMLGGLALGGLIGMIMGTGFGGGIGFLGLLLQMALIAGAVMLAMRFFGRGRQTASAGYAPATAGNDRSASPLSGFGQGFGAQANREANRETTSPGFSIPRIGGGNRPAQVRQASSETDEIGIGPDDLDVFETILKQVQSAYAGEDYATLRKLTTPEAMSYLAEELSDNATKGLKNEVSDVTLVQGDVAESWREDGGDYATVAMRYESIDVLRERATGRVVEGDPDRLTETVELWTFLRKRGGDWQVSAIQGAAA
jgi:predicted lipid-binding transport protein (Tim44 family)